MTDLNQHQSLYYWLLTDLVQAHKECNMIKTCLLVLTPPLTWDCGVTAQLKNKLLKSSAIGLTEKSGTSYKKHLHKTINTKN